MRIITLREYKTSPPVELSALQRDSLRRLVPDLVIEPAPGESSLYLLTPGSRVGLIALDQLAIEIVPKLDIERVLFLLSYSLGLAKWDDTVAVGMQPHDSLIEALVPVFAHHLERALRRGVLQGYRTDDDSLMGVRGRIRFSEQVQRRFGVLLPVQVRFDEFTEDILENRLLKSALAMLGNLPLRSGSSRRSLRRFEYILDLATAQAYDPQNVPRVVYHRLNEHYRGAVEWARLILRYASFEPRHGNALATAVLFDMNAVFEQFVRVAIRDELGLTRRDFPAGKSCPGLFLDSDRRILLQPDLSWWVGKSCRFIGDVKYKAVNIEGIKHPDLYQLLGYTTAADLPDALLVYAAGGGVSATHAVRFAGKLLHVRSLKLEGNIESIRAEVRHLANLVQKLASAPD